MIITVVCLCIHVLYIMYPSRSQSNTSVVNLNLQDNWLGTDGGSHICEMLKENCYITHLVSGLHVR